MRADVPGGGRAALWDAVLARGAVPCGLGARDTLRLEVCYPLHGNDITPETDAISAGLGWACALDKEFTGVDELRRIKEAGPERRLVAFVMEEKAIPRQGMAIAGRRRGHLGNALADARPRHRHGLRAGSRRRARAPSSTIDVRGRQRRATRRHEADLQARGVAWRQRRAIPTELRYHSEHDWARIDGDEAVLGITWFAQDALGELVHFEAPEAGATVAKDAVVRRGRVGEGRLRHDRAAVRRGAGGEPEGRRGAGDGERGPLRRGVAGPDPALRSGRGRLAAGR